MRLPTLSALTLTLTTAAATRLSLSLSPRQPPTILFHVSNFTAFMADPYVEGAQSNLSFHVADTRPGYEAAADCVVPNTYFSLWAISALFDVCQSPGDPKADFSYSYGERGLSVRRGWSENGTNGTSYVVGSGMAEWYWKEEGSGKNVTRFKDGKMYERKEEWKIPVSRIGAGTPP